jgi:hypothetical protein
MADETTLVPPRAVICERLTSNARERQVLRTLLRLSVRQEQWSRQAQQSQRQPQEART